MLNLESIFNSKLLFITWLPLWAYLQEENMFSIEFHRILSLCISPWTWLMWICTYRYIHHWGIDNSSFQDCSVGVPDIGLWKIHRVITATLWRLFHQTAGLFLGKQTLWFCYDDLLGLFSFARTLQRDKIKCHKMALFTLLAQCLL